MEGLGPHTGGQASGVNADNVIPLAIGIVLFLAVIVWPIVGVTLAAT